MNMKMKFNDGTILDLMEKIGKESKKEEEWYSKLKPYGNERN